MELLLNFAWLLMALPAYWLWRASNDVQFRRRVTSAQCLIALGCGLVVLFPIVSATDDLHAMSAEMEESPSGKRSISQKSSDKPSSFKWHSQPALASGVSVLPRLELSDLQFFFSSFSVPSGPSIERPGRAPPQSQIG
jgi:hypothetical protein